MATYHPAVYRTSGGDQLQVASGGVVVLDSGATLTLNGQAITSTGAITGNTITPTAGVVESIQTMTSSAGVLTGYGLSRVKSSGGTTIVHTITPAVGYVKYIVCQNACATTGALIVTTTGTWDGTNKHALFSTGNSNTQNLMAIGLSTALWGVLSYSTDVTFTNT